MRYLLILFVLFTGTAYADGDSWIRKANPDELYTFTFADDCPFSDEALTRETQGVLIRSRIRPVERWNPRETLLYVDVTCFRSSSLYLFDIDIFLAKFEHNADGDVVVSHSVANYGTLGQGNSQFILDAVEEGVEQAMTDYLVANFDLGEKK
ncbi:MAG: hypothetical protein QNI99_04195 [Woeseiaceae bacterium]|nr:hypothetical protein [Woeseiaceae bacterium]